jgi:hypothetical protein
LQILGAETQLQIEWTDRIAQDGEAKLHFCRSNINRAL